MRESFEKFIKGFICGVAAIIPGVSGGVFATVLGIYEPIMDSLSGFFKDIRKNTLFLLPYILGGGLGFLAFSKVIAFLILHFPNQVLFLFSGLVIGGLPMLFAEANNEGFSRRYIIFLFLFLSLSIALEDIYKIRIENDFLRYFIGGGGYAVGSIIPGISASFTLINKGIYEEILNGFTDTGKIIPFIIGFSLISIAIIKGVSFLFKKFHGYSYYSVIGLLLASILSALPTFSNPISDIFFLAVGIISGLFFINP